MIAVLFLFAIVLILLLSKMKSFKREAKEILSKIIKQTFFNNIIRSITLSYIETAIQMKVLIETNPESPAIKGI